MCQTVNAEMGGPRQVLQTEGFIAFCPWAPSYPYEFCISPKNIRLVFLKLLKKKSMIYPLFYVLHLAVWQKQLKTFPITWYFIYLLKRKIVDKFIGILKFIQ